MGTGIHHITLITRKVQANVDFYVGFLGLRLVKQTGGYEDATQLHLFYGDGAASPGSLITFLVWEDGARGRVGHGQPSEISLAIEPSSIGFWLTRALSHHVEISGPVDEMGEPTLRLKDPDGVIVKLVGVSGFAAPEIWEGSGVPAEHAIRRIRGATIMSEVPELTESFVTRHFGYQPMQSTEFIRRLVSDSGDIIDIRDAKGFWTSAPGTGTIDHIAFRARDTDEVERVHGELASSNSTITNVHDRKYFYSLYVREPGGTLFELATDGPGMAIDEPVETMGTQLFVPPERADKIDELLTMLPQFSWPGEERVIYRDLPFVHRFYTPGNADGSVIVLLHGSGGNETSLLPFAAKAAPRATLLALRGRATDEGTPRWFRRLSASKFDQADIRSEAEALAAFIEDAVDAYRIDPEKLVFLGHSNGANMIAATMLLHPHLIRRAVLLRPAMVLEQPPSADLSDVEALLVAGNVDVFSNFGLDLAGLLLDAGANVDARTIPSGHAFEAADVEIVRGWIAARD
ncbi:alpha/beta fold hydrolase [Aminobacter niigataensis]|uniref:alpha/beta fold hydrolase n=1 Tax=Aminobacter niigataensis TaxID=83265 RepID=UPI0024C7A496|nr:alpha/beta fold hydrolase [Aminobacter niigataensis]CAI2931934.1 Glyoxalase family protein [Aminobacter niigataensis]